MKKIKTLIINTLAKFGFYRKNFKNTYKYEFIYLLLFALQKKNYKIIQIGANDGSDLLNKFNNDFRNKITYFGIEPQKAPFERLKKTYMEFKNFYFYQDCIGKKGISNIYYFNKNYEVFCKKNNLKFGDGINSLVKENLIKRLIPYNLDPATYISKYEIRCSPLVDVLKKNNVNIDNYKDIDLLQIDAEGYDDEVVYNSNIELFQPKYINFEYKNLSKTKLDNLLTFLNANSYKCILYKHNDGLATRTI